MMKLNWQTILIEEAQQDIRLYIRDFLLGRKTYNQTKDLIDKVIKECVKDIEIKELKVSAKRGLEQFSNEQIQKCMLGLGVPYQMLLLVMDRSKKGSKLPSVLSTMRLNPTSTTQALMPRKDRATNFDDGLDNALKPIKPSGKGCGDLGFTITKTKYDIGIGGRIWDLLGEQRDVVMLGVPNREWDKIYGERVEKELNRLCNEDAQEDGFSLRNKAEINVRDAKHKQQIQDFMNRGINLVICSSHSNCSKRCEHWQGKYYTLDNSYREQDGIQFQPLQRAVDIWYQAKNGSWYRNGLFGFNCRHYLIPYEKGKKVVPQSAELVEKQRELDKKQRELERLVRNWEARVEIYYGVDEKEYAKAFLNARKWRAYYEQWCKANQRPVMPSRLKIYNYDVKREKRIVDKEQNKAKKKQTK